MERPEPIQVEHPALLKNVNRTLELDDNIGLAWKYLPGIKSQAYLASSSMMKTELFKQWSKR